MWTTFQVYCLLLCIVVSPLKCYANDFEPFWTRVISVLPNVTQMITIYGNYGDIRLPDWVRFVSVGVHTHTHNITLSYDYHKSYNNSICGRNVGLILMVDTSGGNVFVSSNTSAKMNALLVVNAHMRSDPIPGACNHEFPIEISPFLRLYSNKFVDRLDYQLANIVSSNDKLSKCDSSQYQIKYETYAYYIHEADMSEDEYFDAITIMSKTSSVRSNAQVMNSLKPHIRTRILFYAYRGRGVVYNVIATSQMQSSAYIPAVTYNCDDLNICDSLSITASIVAFVLGAFGLVICIRGHQYFNLQMLFFGYIDGAFISYILFLSYTSLKNEYISIYTLSLGGISALIWFAIWRIFKSPNFSLMLSGLTFGFLLMSTLMFTQFGNLFAYQSEWSYWALMTVVTIVFTLTFVSCHPIALSIISTAIVGSYVCISAIDVFIDGSLSYIVYNVIKHAFVGNEAHNYVPFQSKDIILSAIWGSLAVLGLLSQTYRSMKCVSCRSTSCYEPNRETSRRHRQQNVSHEDLSPHNSHSTTRRTQRFNPVPSAPNVDERSPLLTTNYNFLNDSSRVNSLSSRSYEPPPDYFSCNQTQMRQSQYNSQ